MAMTAINVFRFLVTGKLVKLPDIQFTHALKQELAKLSRGDSIFNHSRGGESAEDSSILALNEFYGQDREYEKRFGISP